MNLIKKIGIFTLANIISLSVFAGCKEKEPDIEITLAPSQSPIIIGNTEDPDEGTPSPTVTKVPTDAPTPTMTPVPTPTPTLIPTAPPTPTPDPSAPYVDTYLDIESMRTIYINPGQTLEVDGIGEGTAPSWQTENKDILSLSAKDGKLFIKGEKTGFTKIACGSDYIMVYCLKPMPENENTKKADGCPYFLYYEKASHTLTVFTLNDNGYYTVPVRTISAACGSVPSKTPTGMHTLESKMEWKTFSAKCFAPFAIQYASGVYLHGPCYEYTRRNSILSYYYNSIGINSTGGCVRMQVANIMWIYENCEIGTKFLIVDEAELGTSSMKPLDISDSACYDPTDPLLKK